MSPKEAGYSENTRLLSEVTLEGGSEKSTDLARFNTIGFKIPIPIFDMGQARLSRTQAYYNQSVQRLYEMAVNVRSQTREAYAASRYAYDTAEEYQTNIVKINQAVFFNGFKSVRMIIDRVGHGLTLKITVLDAEDNQPIKGVSCKLILITKYESDKQFEIVKKTAIKGGLYIKSLPEGTYNLSLSKFGYKTKIQVVNISKNEFVNLNVSIEKS